MTAALRTHPDAVRIAARRRASGAVAGNPEDAIRGPAETLFEALGNAISATPVTIVPKTPQPDLHVRPDIAILAGGALAAYVELKAPGKGSTRGASRSATTRSDGRSLKRCRP
ncbi:MAG: hypothetical protein ACU0CO_03705 [Shimia sp.]